AATVTGFVAWRIATGIGASGVVPISLTLIGDVVPFEKRGRALGWLFGAIAGGTAAGATVGALMEPVIGWQGLFLAVTVLTVVLGIVAISGGAIPKLPRPAPPVVRSRSRLQLAAVFPKGSPHLCLRADQRR